MGFRVVWYNILNGLTFQKADILCLLSQKVVPVQPIKAYMGSGGIAPFINLSTRWR